MGIEWVDSSLESSLAELRSANAVNVIFGAGCFGQMLSDACKNAGIAIAAFCDNSLAKVGTNISETPVIPPKAIAEQYLKANVLVAAADGLLVDAMVHQLAELGMPRCFGAQFLEKFARLKNRPTIRDDGYVIEEVIRQGVATHRAYVPGSERLDVFNIGYYITDSCSLNCKNCGSFIPEFTNPYHTPLATIIRDIDRVCECVDSVTTMSVIGGDPFMHPDFHTVIQHLTDMEKIGGVTLHSNGMILPRKEQWEALRHKKVFVSIADYGLVSRNIERLLESLEENGVRGAVISYGEEGWFEYMIGSAVGRSDDELARHFAGCGFNRCFMMGEGRLYRCGTILSAMKLGKVPESPEDFIDIWAQDMDEQEFAGLRSRIREYIYAKRIIRTCDYCTGSNAAAKRVRPAEQIERTTGVR